MIKHIFCIFLLSSIMPVFAYITTNQNSQINYDNFNSKLKMNQPKTIISSYEGSRRHNLLYPNDCPNCYYNKPYLSKSDLNALEKYALNRTYRRENDLQRLERLENLAFGSTQYGDLISRYNNVENAILSRPKYKTENSFLGNLANYFSGQATGYTPNLIQYPSFNSHGRFTSSPYSYMPNPGYKNHRIEQYSNGIFGGGWGISGSDFGTGSSVKILP